MQTYTGVLTAITCCHANCGVTFGLDADHEKNLRRTHNWFHCPNGHSQHFNQRTEAEKLRDELAREKHAAEQARARAEANFQRSQRLERKLSAAKGQRTKMLKRAKAGICLHCHRTFKNVADHMAEKHGGQHGQKGPR
jgi:protein subunit release factor B